MRAFKDTPTPRYLVADAKLYCEDNAVHLGKLGFITRMPATLKLVSQVIGQALQWDTWQPFDDHTRYQPLALCHYGMAQRWLVVYSQAAFERAEGQMQLRRNFFVCIALKITALDGEALFGWKVA